MAGLIGQRIGSYEIVASLGMGGMGEVYRAHQKLGEGIVRDVALKLIDPRLALNQEFVRRFEREARALLLLSHPHILKAFDFGHYNSTVYLVMELLTGGSLANAIGQGPLPLETTLRLLEQICPALDYAHEQGVIHRDLKPQNVLLDSKGNAFLTDFGIAKLLGESAGLTATNAAIGTPAYMAPEQWTGRTADARTDLYSFGVMLYEMLTGHAPFRADTPYALMYLHVHEPPPPVDTFADNPDLPPKLNRIMQRIMAKEPADRYPSAAALLTDFKRAVAGEPLDRVSAAHAKSSREALSGSTIGKNAVEPSPDKTKLLVTPSNRRWLFSGILLGILLLIGIGVAVVGTSLSATITPSATVTASPPQIALIVLSPDAIPSRTDLTTPTATKRPALPPTALVVALVTQSSTTAASSKRTETATASPAPTSIPSHTPTRTATATPTASNIPTNTQTRTLNPTATNTPTATPTNTFTSTATNTPTSTDTPTAVPTATATNTSTFTATDIPTDTDTPTDTPTATPTNTSTFTATDTPTPAGTPLGGGSGWIVFKSTRDKAKDIYAMRVDGSEVHRLTDTQTDNGDIAPSPDGKLIAFTSNRENNKYQVYLMNTDGSNVQQLTSIGENLDPAWSPDGTQIAFVSTRDNGLYQIYVMDADGSNQHRIVFSGSFNAEPAWSPDGKQLFFNSDRSGSFQLYSMNPSGLGLRRITFSYRTDVYPAWSPDGKHILFSSDRTGRFEIYTMNPDGSNVKQLTNSPSATSFNKWPSWSPDGTEIIFTSDRTGDEDVYIMNADGSDLHDLIDNPANDGDGGAFWIP